MLAIHAALWGSTGSWEMLVFQTLSAGNIEQLGAPGSGVPADAGSGAAISAIPPPTITVAINMARTARGVTRTARGVTRTARFDISITPHCDRTLAAPARPPGR